MWLWPYSLLLHASISPRGPHFSTPRRVPMNWSNSHCPFLSPLPSCRNGKREPTSQPLLYFTRLPNQSLPWRTLATYPFPAAPRLHKHGPCEQPSASAAFLTTYSSSHATATATFQHCHPLQASLQGLKSLLETFIRSRRFSLLA